MYTYILFAHSWLRWAVFIIGVVAIVKAYMGWKNNEPFTADHKRTNAFLIASIHTQLLLGFILYFGLSPKVQAAFQNFGLAMKDPTSRYWAVEHITGMIIAAAIIQIGSIKSKKQASDTQKHRTAFRYFTIGYVIILLTILSAIMTDKMSWFRFEI